MCVCVYYLGASSIRPFLQVGVCINRKYEQLAGNAKAERIELE